MSNELMLNEDIYLLYGSIPVERLCFMKGIISNRDKKEVFESDLRERFYIKSKCGIDGFTLNSANYSGASEDIYFFGYADNDISGMRDGFVGLKEFLCKAKFIGRTFRPNPDDFSSFEGRAISEAEYDMVVNDQTKYELVCVLGNVAIIKKRAFVTSGYSVVDISKTPLVGNEYIFLSDEETKEYDKNEILKGIEQDLRESLEEMMNDVYSTSGEITI